MPRAENQSSLPNRRYELEDGALRNFFENSVEGIYRSSLDGTFVFVNTALAYLFGCNDVPDFFSTYTDIAMQFYADPSTRDRIQHVLARQNSVQGFECLGRRKDGSTFWMLENARVLRDAYGSVVGYEGFVHDIDRRKAAEERYRLIVEGSNEGIWEWRSSSPSTYYASNRFQEITKIAVPNNRLHVSLWRSRIHPEDLDDHDRKQMAFFNSTRRTSAIEYRVRGDDGVYRWVLDRGCAERDAHNHIIHMAGSLGDVTEQRTYQELLEATNRDLQRAKDAAEATDQAKTAFLATMSHELRTPLNAIIGFADILKNASFGPLGSSRYEEYAKDIYESANYLHSIIADILDVARLEAGNYSLDKDLCDVSSSVEQACRLVSSKAQAKGINLCIRQNPSAYVFADETRLKQVLLNILNNAIKYTYDGGTIDVVHEIHQNEIIISVTDTGEGMDESMIPIAFQAFRQVHARTTRQHEGCGIGLALAEKLMQLHNGSIELDSTIGSGTTARIRLPASSDSNCL